MTREELLDLGTVPAGWGGKIPFVGLAGFCPAPGCVILLLPFSFFPSAPGKLRTPPDPQ